MDDIKKWEALMARNGFGGLKQHVEIVNKAKNNALFWLNMINLTHFSRNMP
jgi:hypothetical protein